MPAQSASSVLASVLLVSLLPIAACQAESNTDFAKHIGPYLQQHCISCHGPDKQKAKLRLDQLTAAYDPDMLDTWTYVFDVLQSKEMPPKDQPQPSKEQNQAVMAWIKSHLSQSRKQGGSGSFRRLNRREIANTFNDLFGIQVEFESMLPPDGMKDNFDKRASALHFSDILLERYLAMTQKVLDHTHVWGEPKAVTEHRFDFIAIAKMSNNKEKQKVLAYKNAVKDLKPQGLLILAKGPIFGEEFQRAFRQDFAMARVAAPSQSPSALMEFEITFHAESKHHHRQPILQIYNHKRIVAEFPITGTSDKVQTERFHVFNHGAKSIKIGIEAIYPMEGVKQNFPVKDAPQIFIQSLDVRDGFQARLDLPGWSADKSLGGSDDAGARQWLTAFTAHAVRRPDYDASPWIKQFDGFRQAGLTIEAALKSSIQALLTHPDFLCLQSPEGLEGSRRQAAIANRLSYFLWSTAPDQALLQLAREGKLEDGDTLAQQVQRLLADPRADRFFKQFVLQWTGMNKLALHFNDRHRWYGMTRFVSEAMQNEAIALFKELIDKNLPASHMLDSDFAMRNNIMAAYYGEQHDDMQPEFRATTLPPNSPKSGLIGQAGIMALTSHGQAPITRGTWMLRTILDDPPPPPPLNVPELNSKDPNLHKKPLREQLRAHQDHPDCALCHRKIDPLGFAFEQFGHSGLFHIEGHGADRKKKDKKKKKKKKKNKNNKDQSHKDLADKEQNANRDSSANPKTNDIIKVDTSGAMPQGETFADFNGMKKLLLENYTDDFVRGLSKFLLAYGIGRDLHPDDLDSLNVAVSKLADKEYPLRDLITALVQGDSFLQR